MTPKTLIAMLTLTHLALGILNFAVSSVARIATYAHKSYLALKTAFDRTTARPPGLRGLRLLLER